jgi:hypothetical protein
LLPISHGYLITVILTNRAYTRSILHCKYQLELKDGKADSPSRHESQHHKSITKSPIILEPGKVGSALFGQAEYFHVEDRKEDE